MDLWATLLLALVTGSVPGVILFILQRRGANKKLELEEGSLGVSQFNAQTSAYQDLLDRANAAVTEARNETKKYRAEREALQRQVTEMREEIDKLKTSDDQKGQELLRTNNKLERLRALFLSYVKRTSIPLTEEEQSVFDDTMPADIFKRTVNQDRSEE